MTTKRFVQGFIVTVALCLSATAGRAQNNKFFLMAAGSSFNDSRSFYELYIPYSTQYATGAKGIVGVEVPLKKSKVFGLEASYGLGDNNLKLADLEYTYKPITAYSMRINRVSGDLVARPRTTFRGARPYVVFGIEYDRFSPTGRASSLATTEGFAAEPTAKLGSQGTGGVNFGGGLDFRAASSLGLRIDVREHIMGSNTFGLPTTQPSTAGLPWFPATGNAHNIEYSIGVVYRFGRKQASSPSSQATPTPSPQATPSPRPSPPRRSSDSWPSPW